MGTLAESLFVRYTHDEPPIATLSLMKSKETTVRLMLRQCSSSPELPKLLQGRQRRHEGLSPPIDDLKRALSDGGYQVTEQDHLLQIMAGTQEDFGPYISIQTGNCALKDIDRNELCDQLIKQDMYRKTSKSHKNGKVFMTGAPSSQSQNGELRIETDATGRHVTKPTSKRSPVYNQSNRRCYNCHEIGHISKDCPNPKKDRSTNKAASSDEESANKSKHKKPLMFNCFLREDRQVDRQSTGRTRSSSRRDCHLRDARQVIKRVSERSRSRSRRGCHLRDARQAIKRTSERSRSSQRKDCPSRDSRLTPQETEERSLLRFRRDCSLREAEQAYDRENRYTLELDHRCQQDQDFDYSLSDTWPKPQIYCFSILETGNDLEDQYILDSGANAHSCRNPKDFIDFSPCNETITVGNNSTVEVIGRGTVKLNVMTIGNSSSILVLNNVACGR